MQSSKQSGFFGFTLGVGDKFLVSDFDIRILI